MKRPVWGFSEDGDAFIHQEMEGDPFEVPDFHVMPRSPANEPVMPTEVYYNKMMQHGDGLTTPGGWIF